MSSKGCKKSEENRGTKRDAVMKLHGCLFLFQFPLRKKWDARRRCDEIMKFQRRRDSAKINSELGDGNTLTSVTITIEVDHPQRE